MSPTVGNFVHDLVEMAKAMETLPLVQAELDRYQQMHFEDGDRIARLEQRLIDRANEMDALYSKLRSVEAERDDASFRQLEAEDKVVSVIREVGALQAALRGIEMTLNPPAPEPEPEPVPTTPAPVAAEHIPAQENAGSTATSVEPQPVHAVVSIAEPQGESASHPTVSSQPHGESGTVSVGESSPSTEPQEPAPKLGKYHGRRYYDIPVYISLTDWLNGGGSIDDYHWRPEPKAVG